ALGRRDREVRRRPGRRGEPRRGHRGGTRHDRRRARALPHPAGLPAEDTARPHRHRARLPALRAHARAARGGFVLMSRIAVKPTLQPELFVYSFPVRVYFESTDAGGVVYHAEYLKFLERARTEWLRHLGFDHQALAREHRVVFVVSSPAAEFLKPADPRDNVAV